jgi:hypothetical protein
MSLPEKPSFLPEPEARLRALAMSRFIVNGSVAIPEAILDNPAAAHDSAYELTEHSLHLIDILDEEGLAESAAGAASMKAQISNWEPDGEKINSLRLLAVYNDFVEAFKNKDEGGLSAARARMRIQDDGMWENMLYNLEHHHLPDIEREMKDTPRHTDENGDEKKSREEVEAQAQHLLEELTFPNRRYQEITKAVDHTTGAVEILPLVDLNRAQKVYELILADNPDMYNIASEIEGGLINISLIQGKLSLPLWGKALRHPSEEVRNMAQDSLLLVIEEIDHMLNELRDKQDRPKDYEKAELDIPIDYKIDEPFLKQLQALFETFEE